MYRRLFFDFDGTICDTSQGIYATLDDTFAHYGMTVDRRNYPRWIGPPLSETFETLFGDRDKAYEAVAYFRKCYCEGNIRLTRLYDGIADLFARLKADGFSVCVATCKKEEEAIALLKSFGVYDSVDFVSGLVYHLRETKQEVLSHALDSLGAKVEECVMIGDTVFDSEGAQAVGMDCIICEWGFGVREQLTQPNIVFFAASPEDVRAFLTQGR